MIKLASIRTFMDRKRRFVYTFGFFGVMYSIFPKNMLNDFGAHEVFFHSTSNVKQLVNPQNLTFGFNFGFSSFEMPLKATIKAYKTTKTITKYENGFDFPNQSLIPTRMNKNL